jgi:mono/diheme cytochrome c family protein
LAAATATPSDADLIAQGEYLVRIGGCNDCHTPGYGDVAGAIPKEQWLLGSPIGFHGPWGTTFPANLRLKTADMDDAAWLKYSGELHTRPIMPDFQLRAMKEQDRLAIFRFIKSLGPAGQPAPAYLPPTRSRKFRIGIWCCRLAHRRRHPLPAESRARQLGLEAWKPYNFGTLSGPRHSCCASPSSPITPPSS